MWKIRVVENITPKFEVRGLRNFEPNGSELKEKKNNLWTVVPVLNINRLCCKILEKFSSFCTRKGSKLNS